MEFIINLYKPFIDPHNWQTVITSPNDWLLILSLVIMECLLSVDNSIVLAAQAHTLTGLTRFRDWAHWVSPASL